MHETKYQLTVAVLGRTPQLEITKERFEVLRRSRATLVAALALEEKYEILLANYLSLEQEILHRAALELIRDQLDYYDFFEARLLFNVRLVNLLTAARLYVDQIPRHVRTCVTDNPNALEEVKSLLSAQYDSCSSYRFMEAFRNYVQHNGVPVHTVRTGGAWTGKPSEGYLESGVGLFALKKFLAADPDFKKKVLAECDEEIDLMTASRSYMESLSHIHCDARKLIDAPVDAARLEIESARSDYEAINSSSEFGLLGLEAQFISDFKVTEQIPMLLEWDDVRAKLKTKNRLLKNLARRYVTGRSRTRK